MSALILDTTRDEFRGIKKFAEKALAQFSDEEFHRQIDPESNSAAIIVRHMAGNMRSRWTDFLTSDGEKADRQRDQEFESPATSRAEVMAEWEDGWARLFAALEPLTDADLARTVIIRAEPLTVARALSRQVAHYAGHAYQLAFLGKHLKGAGWTTLSVPRGQSDQYNREMIARLQARG